VPAVVESAVAKLAAQTGEPEQDLRAETQKNIEMFKQDYQPLLAQINKSVEDAKPDSEAIKQQGLGQALAQFGFKMAAAASRPGARFLESASAASPELSSAAAKMQELTSAQQQNYNKLKMDQAKYEVALQNGNMRDAVAATNQIRAGRQADKQLAATMAHYQDQFAIQQEQLKVQRQQVAATAGRQPEDLRSLAAVLMKDDQSLTMSQALEQASKLRYGASADIRSDASTKAALAKGLTDIDKEFPPITLQGDSKLAQRSRAERQERINRLYETYGMSPSSGAAASTGGSAPAGGGSTIMRFDAKGNPI
jgi:hypothetical protein